MTDSSSSPGSSFSPEATSSLSFPLDAPASDLDEAVQKLRQCPRSELRRACKHHRRALKALREGGFEALSSDTRKQLVDRFQTNLNALTNALNTPEPASEHSTSSSTPSASSPSASSTSPSRVLSALPTWIW